MFCKCFLYPPVAIEVFFISLLSLFVLVYSRTQFCEIHSSVLDSHMHTLKCLKEALV